MRLDLDLHIELVVCAIDRLHGHFVVAPHGRFANRKRLEFGRVGNGVAAVRRAGVRVRQIRFFGLRAASGQCECKNAQAAVAMIFLFKWILHTVRGRANATR